MKIIHLAKPLTGIESYIRNVSFENNLFAETVIVKGFDDTFSDLKDFKGDDVKIYSISLRREIALVDDFKAIIQFCRILRAEKPDIIHCHSSKAGLIGRLCGFITNIKTVFTPHAFSFLYFSNRFKSRLFIFLERLTRFDSFLMACSSKELEIGREIIKYPVDKSYLWRNSINLPLEVRCGRSTPQYRIVSIGRNSYQKNTKFLLDVLLASLIESPIKFKITIAGLGENIDELLDTLKNHPFKDNVDLVKSIGHEDLMRLVSDSLIYISLSRYEGLPIAVLEAMALGKPLLLSDIDGHVECISKTGINGYLFPLDDSTCIRNKVVELMCDEKLTLNLGRNSFSHFEKEFKLSNSIDVIKENYKSIIKS